MAGVDSLLKIAADNGADELRLGTDRAPRIFQRGAPLRLSVPDTSNATLRYLLAPLLDGEREATLRKTGDLHADYQTEAGTRYQVVMTRRGPPDEAALPFDVVFTRSGARPAGPAAVVPVAVASHARRVDPEPTEEAVSPLAPTPSFQRAVADAAASTVSAELQTLLQRAVSLRASDLHLAAGEPPALRVDGAFRRIEGPALLSVEELIGEILDEPGRAALAARGSVDLALAVPELGRFRVHVYRSAAGPVAAIRVLPRRTPELDELHLPVSLDPLCELPHGLVIVCGPTGSGKSATLAALAQAVVRRRGALLVTLEDPVEYAIDPRTVGDAGGLVRQRQIGRDAPDFPSGLRDALRADPDVLLIGEMRDPETIGLALTASETGHLVLASLHSPSAASALERIVDAYPAGRQQQIRVQLADALQAVIAQRLVPRAAGSGRLPAVEVLRRSSNIASLIREGKTAQIASAIQSGRKDGMLSLEACLAELVRSRQIGREQAQAACNDPSALAGYLA